MHTTGGPRRPQAPHMTEVNKMSCRRLDLRHSGLGARSPQNELQKARFDHFPALAPKVYKMSRRRPEKARGGPRRPLETSGGPRSPRRRQKPTGSPRRPQETPGGPRKPQKTPGDPTRPQETPGGPKMTPGCPKMTPGDPRRPQEAISETKTTCFTRFWESTLPTPTPNYHF